MFTSSDALGRVALGVWPTLDCFVVNTDERTLRITPVSSATLDEFLEGVSPEVNDWIVSSGFKAKPGKTMRYPSETGAPAGVLVGISDPPSLYDFASLVDTLPVGRYIFDENLEPEYLEMAVLAWGLASYSFDHYKKRSSEMSELVIPADYDVDEIYALLEGIYLARDLINTPAEDLGPQDLADEINELAVEHDAEVQTIVGEKLIDKGYPAVYAVGRASSRKPQLIDLRWGDESHPKITLVGKGVCFDSGGLDLKTSAGMLLMKKDMGGAAIALGLAHAIMKSGWPVCLRVLIPAVENAISGDAFRPMDILQTRKGLSVEVNNTDAEGRLILSDALTEACSEKPEVVIDFATLTGAARVALGADLPALFSNEDSLANAILENGLVAEDPLWRMPLHSGYKGQLDSKFADISNVSSSRYAGAITAALFLQYFVDSDVPWAHIDVMAWNLDKRPGRPKGGEAMGLRAIYYGLLQWLVLD